MNQIHLQTWELRPDSFRNPAIAAAVILVLQWCATSRNYHADTHDNPGEITVPSINNHESEFTKTLRNGVHTDIITRDTKEYYDRCIALMANNSTLELYKREDASAMEHLENPNAAFANTRDNVRIIQSIETYQYEVETENPETCHKLTDIARQDALWENIKFSERLWATITSRKIWLK